MPSLKETFTKKRKRQIPRAVAKVGLLLAKVADFPKASQSAPLPRNSDPVNLVKSPDTPFVLPPAPNIDDVNPVVHPATPPAPTPIITDSVPSSVTPLSTSPIPESDVLYFAASPVTPLVTPPADDPIALAAWLKTYEDNRTLESQLDHAPVSVISPMPQIPTAAGRRSGESHRLSQSSRSRDGNQIRTVRKTSMSHSRTSSATEDHSSHLRRPSWGLGDFRSFKDGKMVRGRRAEPHSDPVSPTGEDSLSNSKAPETQSLSDLPLANGSHVKVVRRSSIEPRHEKFVGEAGIALSIADMGTLSTSDLVSGAGEGFYNSKAIETDSIDCAIESDSSESDVMGIKTILLELGELDLGDEEFDDKGSELSVPSLSSTAGSPYQRTTTNSSSGSRAP